MEEVHQLRAQLWMSETQTWAFQFKMTFSINELLEIYRTLKTHPHILDWCRRGTIIFLHEDTEY